MKVSLHNRGLAGLRRVATAVLLAATVVVVAPAGAQADQTAKGGPASGLGTATSDYLSGVDPSLLQRQEALMSYKSWLIGVPKIYEAGFVESANYPETLSTTLLWAGESSLQATVRAEAERRGIAVTIKPVRYSRKRLQDGMDQLWASVHSPAWKDFVVTSILGPDLTHDGLVVRGHYQARPDVSATEQAQTLGSARSVADSVEDIAITPEPTLYATRSTDNSPYNAGGMIRGSDGSGCTSGFAIWKNSYPWTTTARHCNAAPYGAWDAPGNSYGQSYMTTTNGARVLTGDGYPWMFDGAWNDPAGYHKTVVGFADLSIRDWVCTSGANSGFHCNIQVDNLWVNFDDGYGVFPTIRGQQRDSAQIAAAHGDSGGPVFVPFSSTTVGAAGMIQGSLGPLTWSCGSLRFSTTCSSEVEFSSMRSIVNELGATLRTG